MSTVHRPLSTIFMGTPAFAVPSLQALHEAGHEIAAVYSQPPRPAGRGQKETPSPVHRFALEHRLPVYTPVSLKLPETQAEFAAHKADVAVVAAYGLLLPQPILDAYPHGCINVHPSLLPRWRGAAPIQRTIMAGDTLTGICIMQMDAGLDTGDILLKQTLPVPDSFDAGMLHDTLAEAAGPLLLQTLEAIKNGSAVREKQSADGVTYAKKITKEECGIDWKEQTAEEIYRKIRGLSPAPGAYFKFGHHGNQENIKIFDAGFDMNYNDPVAGIIIEGRNLTYTCKQGRLSPKLVQRPGKNRMTIEEFLRGIDVATIGPNT